MQMPANGPISDANNLLDVKDFAISIGAIKAVSSITLSVKKGEVYGIVGESGAGKSATAKGIVGLVPPIAKITGSVRFKGEELVGMSPAKLRQVRGRKIGYIFQDALTALDPVRTIGQQLIEALQVHEVISKKDAHQRGEALLAELKITDPLRVMNSFPHQLSGGMRQRAVIATALIADPELIIADEVTSALDVTVQRKVLDILLDVCANRGAGVIMITHDLGVVAQTCDRVAVLYGGVVAEEADVFTLFDHPRHPYTHALMQSMPRIGEDRPFQPIPGSAIQILGRLNKCPFEPRCSRPTPECRVSLPETTHDNGTNFRCLHPVEVA
jgi:oligopeptide/dipeptide ABC transporter ATP-binding protein